MSQPIKHWKGPMGFFAPSGYYVSASDYAALAAENERLRKAGDFTLETIDRYITVEEYEWIAEIEAAWNAAKSGN